MYVSEEVTESMYNTSSILARRVAQKGRPPLSSSPNPGPIVTNDRKPKTRPDYRGRCKRGPLPARHGRKSPTGPINGRTNVEKPPPHFSKPSGSLDPPGVQATATAARTNGEVAGLSSRNLFLCRGWMLGINEDIRQRRRLVNFR
ncbi:hypothetical protein GWI33_018627 [Rhynchophorus ferrugineus]|uniref:Uncharacterized protein n=1 Tax=Rhynchophorus ferrugineus TaxID=354439 RepID=A0A834HUG2_RHYFE|nr:hypothetical protein GWI33_018627 [Rhynchophorus ferrugineus]